MRKPLFGLLFFFLSTISLKANTEPEKTVSLSRSEISLVQLIMQECGYVSVSDSLRVARAVRLLHDRFGVREIRFVKNGTGSSHFVFGTMYINLTTTLASACDVWIDELTHAVQFSEAPIKYYHMAIQNFFQTFRVALFSLTKEEKKEVRLLRQNGCKKWKARLWVAYRRYYKYSDPDSWECMRSLECDAHLRRKEDVRNLVFTLLQMDWTKAPTPTGALFLFSGTIVGYGNRRITRSSANFTPAKGNRASPFAEKYPCSVGE